MASDRSNGDELGFCVSVSGSIIVVGAWADDALGTYSGKLEQLDK